MRDPNKMSHAEAGKLGAVASKSTIEKQKQQRRQEYYQCPKLCITCNNPIPFEKRTESKFCNSSCFDRLEPTFGAKNRGNGRHWRRQRYKDGKSS